MNNKIVPLTNYKSIPPEDMDSFDSDTIKKSNSTYHSNHDGGGSDMDKYVTKGELKNLETKIDGQFDTLDAKLDGYFKNTDNQFEQVNSKLNWLFGIIAAVIIAGLTKFFFG